MKLVSLYMILQIPISLYFEEEVWETVTLDWSCLQCDFLEFQVPESGQKKLSYCYLNWFFDSLSLSLYIDINSARSTTSKTLQVCTVSDQTSFFNKFLGILETLHRKKTP